MRWSDKYRPTTIDGYVFHEGTDLLAILKGGDTPNLILFGPPGTGKTTFARLYGAHLGTPYGTTDYFELDASSLKGVDEVRTNLTDIVHRACSWGEGKTIVHLEECDTLTKPAAVALKPLMENYPDVVFVLTTNNLSSIDTALRSRCDVIPCALKEADISGVFRRLKEILVAEGITFEASDVAEIAADNYKDMRQAIRKLQLKYEVAM